MEQRTLGRTGLRVSALGFGCGDVGGLIVQRHAGRARAGGGRADRGRHQLLRHGVVVRQRRVGAEPRRHAQGASACGPYVGTKFRLEPAETRPGRRHRALARREPAAAGHGQRGPAAAPQPDRARGRRAGARPRPDGPPRPRRGGARPRRRCGARARSASPASPRSATPRAVHQVHRRRRHRHGAGLPEPPQPERGGGRARRAFRPRTSSGSLDRARQRAWASSTSACWPAARSAAPPSATRMAMPQRGADRLRRGLHGRRRAARRRLRPVVDKGYAADLIEASVRFSLASDAMSTVLVGYSTLEHLERAIAAVERGPLPAPALDLLHGLWAGLAQESADEASRPRRAAGAPARLRRRGRGEPRGDHAARAVRRGPGVRGRRRLREGGGPRSR